jgi:hypothetical protein
MDKASTAVLELFGKKKNKTETKTDARQFH